MTTFFYPAVKHIALRIREKRGRLVSDEEALSSALAPDPAAAAGLDGDLAAALQALPPGHREALLLRYVDDLSLEEIAAVLDIPLGTVKSRLHNALKILRGDARCRRYFLGSGEGL